jgi:hypothetical protein
VRAEHELEDVAEEAVGQQFAEVLVEVAYDDRPELWKLVRQIAGELFA